MKTTDSKGNPLPAAVPDSFLAAYLAAMLWSSTDDDDGTPLDSNYAESDIHPDSLDKCLRDCAEFFALCESKGLDPLPEYGDARYSNAELSGHDFWLTRNGHGAGYWDRGLGTGDALTEAAHTFGECWPYVGDDGMVHVS